MTKRPRPTVVLPSLDGHCVHIVGPRVFQNALLANILTTATRVACHLSASREALPELPTTAQPRPLVLEDFLSLEDTAFSEKPAHGHALRHAHALVSLFNLPGNWGQESAALRHGIRGFFYETDLPATIIKGVRHILSGELWATRKAVAASFEMPPPLYTHRKSLPAGLTPREVEVLRLIAEGASNEDIAAQLHLSTHTVKTHLYNAYNKIDVTNRIQAARWATKYLR